MAVSFKVVLVRPGGPSSTTSPPDLYAYVATLSTNGTVTNIPLNFSAPFLLNVGSGNKSTTGNYSAMVYDEQIPELCLATTGSVLPGINPNNGNANFTLNLLHFDKYFRATPVSIDNTKLALMISCVPSVFVYSNNIYTGGLEWRYTPKGDILWEYYFCRKDSSGNYTQRSLLRMSNTNPPDQVISSVLAYCSPSPVVTYLHTIQQVQNGGVSIAVISGDNFVKSFASANNIWESISVNFSPGTYSTKFWPTMIITTNSDDEATRMYFFTITPSGNSTRLQMAYIPVRKDGSVPTDANSGNVTPMLAATWDCASLGEPRATSVQVKQYGQQVIIFLDSWPRSTWGYVATVTDDGILPGVANWAKLTMNYDRSTHPSEAMCTYALAPSTFMS